MKYAAMPKIVGPLLLIVLLIGVNVSGQQEAKVEAPKKVVQDSSINYHITLDKAANVEGEIDVEAASADGGTPLTSGSHITAGRTVNITLAIPLNAKTGKWRISKITFIAGAGIRKDLTPKGDLSFEVTPHEPPILPSQANVEIQ
jgi:hypothetical protein